MTGNDKEEEHERTGRRSTNRQQEGAQVDRDGEHEWEEHKQTGGGARIAGNAEEEHE